MKLNRKFLGISLGVVALLGLVGWRGADGGFCHRGMNPEQAEKMSNRFLDHVLDEVKATPDQRKALQALKDDAFKDGMALHGERKADMNEALKLWESPNPDPQAVHAMLDARLEKMRTFAHESADKLLEAHKVLTPEQRKILADRIREHHADEE